MLIIWMKTSIPFLLHLGILSTLSEIIFLKFNIKLIFIWTANQNTTTILRSDNKDVSYNFITLLEGPKQELGNPKKHV